jgi:hypothetical protein
MKLREATFNANHLCRFSNKGSRKRIKGSLILMITGTLADYKKIAKFRQELICK